MRAALGTEEADVGDVVLAARVRAAGDVRADAADIGQAGFVERRTDGVGQATRLRDGEVARVGARAGDDVAGEFGTRLGHADGREPVEQARELLFGEIAEGEVLAVRDANVEAELTLDRGQRAELIRRDVAELGVGDRRHGALGVAADHVGFLPALVRRRGADADRHALTDGRRRDRGVQAGGRVAFLLHDLGNTAGPRRRCEQEAALLQDARLQLVPAHGVDEPLHAGAELVVAVAVVREDPQDRFERRQQLFARRELFERERGCGLAPRPPATNTRKPPSSSPFSARRALATTPTSLNIAWPQSVSQPEKLILNLRGRRCASGWRRKCWNAASAHGVTSRTSNGQAPARWHASTLRTVSPHASRDVMPTEASSRSTAGNGLEFHEVELDVLAGRDVAPTARVRVGEVAHEVELLGEQTAVGDLDAHHLVVAALTLAVDAVVQPEDAEDVVVELAGEVAGELCLELGDVGQLSRIDLTLQHEGLS